MSATSPLAHPELFILRHGETFWNREGRIQGRLHSDLTERGKEQARRHGQYLAAQATGGWRVISSPQVRALETSLIAFGATAPMIETDRRLCEVDVGSWQGKLRATLSIEGDLKWSDDGPLALYEQDECKGGLAELRRRCLSFLEDLDHPSILITHGITSRMMRAILLGISNDDLVRLPGGQDVIFHMKKGEQIRLTPGSPGASRV